VNGPAGGAAPPQRSGGGGERSEPEGAGAAALPAPPLLSYIAEQEDVGNPAYVTVRAPNGEALAKLG
jgi:hypothetical protein